MLRLNVGSCWPTANFRRELLRIQGRRLLDVDGDRHVVPAPERDRRVVTEQVDRLARLADRLLAHTAGVSPLQRHLLPQEEPRLVGGVVELGPRDMCVHAEQVETRVDREVHVTRDLVRSRLADRHARRPVVRALEEEPLAVHRHDPVAHRHGPEPHPHSPLVAHLVADRHRDDDVVQRLRPERMRPPEGGVVDAKLPLDSVDAHGE